jgi:hypothetical protein
VSAFVILRGPEGTAMQASDVPLCAKVAAMPMVLSCASCAADLTLSVVRDQQQRQIAAFFAAHSGHGGTVADALIEVPAARPADHDNPSVAAEG